MRRDVGANRPPALGVAAFVIAIVGVTVGGVLLFVAGYQAGPISAYIDPAEPAPAVDDLPAAAQEILAEASVWYNVGISVFGIAALWAAIQGVAAYVRRQGRRWALLAIAVAVIGYLVVTSAQQYGASFTAVPFDG